MLHLDAVCFQHTPDTDPYRFNLSVARGTITAISGRSGSGKSTLLDLIAGFLLPSSGHLYWHDQEITALAPDKRPVTTVFQKNNLFEHRNTVDNVVVGIDPSVPSAGPAVARAREILASVGLSKFEKQRVSNLSGGQQQRVALARALIRASGVILLDEPFSALDTETRSHMLSLVRQIADQSSRAIIMVTHDINDSKAIADEHFHLAHGELQPQAR